MAADHEPFPENEVESASASQDSPPELKTVRCLKLAVERPGLACGLTCGSYCLVFLVWIIMLITVPGFLPFSSEVPLYLRHHRARQRQDAVEVAIDESTYTPGQAKIMLQRSINEESGGDDLKLEVMYVPKNGDIFTIENLQYIRSIEEKIMQHEVYREVCALEWSAEAKAVQKEASTSGNYSGVVSLNNAINHSKVPCKAPRSALYGCAQPSEVSPGVYSCAPKTAWSRRKDDVLPRTPPPLNATPPGLLNCRKKEGCSGLGTSNADFEFDQTYIEDAITHYATANPYTDWNVYTMVSYTSSNFGGGEKVAKGLISTFYFGLPIPGYNNSFEDEQAQIEQLSEKAYDAFNDLLWGEESGGVKIWYDGTEFSDLYINEQLMKDGMWAISSCIFVWLYLVFMNGSWVLGSCGMGQILMAFAPSYFIYYGVFQQRYFGTFNVLTVFIIVGIGADNIFVFLDTWAQTSWEPTLKNATRHQRMSWTWKKTSVAMAVTSSTTCIAFISNAASSFPAIQSFGLFAALLVLVNYCAVISYFPTVVCLFDECWKDYPFPLPCGLPGRAAKKCAKAFLAAIKPNTYDQSQFKEQKPSRWCEARQAKIQHLTRGSRGEMNHVHPVAQDEPHDGAVSNEQPDVERGVSSSLGTAVCREDPAKPEDAKSVSSTSSSTESDGKQLRGIELWFHDSFSVFIVTFRFWIILVMLAAVGTLLALATRLEPDPEAPKLLPSDNNYGGYRDVKADLFARGGSVYAIKLRLVWGLDPRNPIDRAGTVDSDMDNYGNPNWYPGYGNQMVPHGAECMRYQCEEAVKKNDELMTGGLPQYPITCWPQALSTFVGPAKWAAMTGKNANVTLFWDEFMSWISDSDILALYKPYIYGKQDGDAGALTFSMAEMKLVAELNMKFDDGIDLYERWEDWLRNVMKHPKCAEICPDGNEGEANTCKAPTFIIDPLAFAFFYVSETMAAEAFQGIGLSVGLACVVIMLATRNVIVTMTTTLIIVLIVICVIGFSVAIGWKLGILQSIVFVMVPGMSVDYVAHLAEAYTVSDRNEPRAVRVRHMLTEIGVSVISGAFSTLGACCFLFAPVIVFFVQFGISIFATILSSLILALFLFPSLMATFGPERNQGDLVAGYRYLKRKCMGQGELKKEEATEAEMKETSPKVVDTSDQQV